MALLELNQSDIHANFAPQTTLGQIILHYESEFQKQGEVICKITLNNSLLTEEDERKLAETQVAHIQQLQIETQNPQVLLEGVVSDWINGIPEIIKTIDMTSEKVRTLGFDGTATSFTNIIDSCHYLVNSLESVRMMLESKASFNLNSWRQGEHELLLAFQGVMDAFLKKDFVLLSDLMEYDLANTLQNWLGQLEQVHAGLQGVDSTYGGTTTEGNR